jgi:hypothetical protein
MQDCNIEVIWAGSVQPQGVVFGRGSRGAMGPGHQWHHPLVVGLGGPLGRIYSMTLSPPFNFSYCSRWWEICSPRQHCHWPRSPALHSPSRQPRRRRLCGPPQRPARSWFACRVAPCLPLLEVNLLRFVACDSALSWPSSNWPALANHQVHPPPFTLLAVAAPRIRPNFTTQCTHCCCSRLSRRLPPLHSSLHPSPRPSPSSTPRWSALTGISLLLSLLSAI